MPSLSQTLGKRGDSQHPLTGHRPVAKRIATVWPAIADARQRDLRRPVRRLLGAARRGTAGLLRPGTPEAGGPTLDGQGRSASSGVALLARPQTALPPHLLQPGMLEAVSRQESRAVYIGRADAVVSGARQVPHVRRRAGDRNHTASRDGRLLGVLDHDRPRAHAPAGLALPRRRREPRLLHADHGRRRWPPGSSGARGTDPAARRLVAPDPRRQRVPRRDRCLHGSHRYRRGEAAARHPGSTKHERSPRPGRRTDRRRGRGRNRDRRHAYPRLAARRLDQDRRRGSGGGRLEGDATNDRAEPRSRRDPRAQRRPLRRPARLPGSDRVRGVQLRYIDFDAEVKGVTIDRLLRRRVGEDWMLYLARR